MKSFMILAVFAALAVYVNAECNNMCSGHGVCSTNDMCLCYRNWRGADCSERTCQFGRSLVDTAQGDLNHDGAVEFSSHNLNFLASADPTGTTSAANGKNADADNTGTNGFDLQNQYLRNVRVQWKKSTFELFPPSNQVRAVNHVYMECSNKGVCDRATGECVCYDGYEGSACQRSVCPNKCNGHGVCRNILDKTQTVAAYGNYTYQLWDATKLQACVCDPGYSGIDCSERLCPRGDDPLNPNQQAQVDSIINFDLAGTTGTFRIQYKDSFGEEWLTSRITLTDYGADTTDNGVAAALLAIPNNVVPSVSVSVADTADAGGNGKAYSITFTGNPGSQNGLVKVVELVTATLASGPTESTVGTKTNEECSSRGLCDYETGICKCFKGYRLADCSGQSALAY